MSRLLAVVVCKDLDSGQSVTKILAGGKNPAEALVKDTHAGALSYIQLKRPDLLLVDWQAEELEKTAAFLQKFRGVSGCLSVPLIVFTKELTLQILACATEYGAGKILNQATLAETLQPTVDTLMSEVKRPSSLKSYLTRIEAATERGAVGEVQQLVEDFYSLYPDHPRAQVEYANVCIRRGNLSKAKIIGTKVIEKDKTNLRALNLMSRVLLSEGKFGEALLMIEDAELLSPKNLERLVLMGDTFRALGENEKARDQYSEVLKIDDRRKDAKTGLGQLELTEGNVNQALELFRDAATEEEIGGFFNNTAVMAVKKQEFDKALSLYTAAQSALQKESLRAKVMFNQGLAYLKWNKLEPAYQAFQKALSLKPDYEKAQRHLLTTKLKMVEDGIQVPQFVTAATEAPQQSKKVGADQPNTGAWDSTLGTSASLTEQNAAAVPPDDLTFSSGEYGSVIEGFGAQPELQPVPRLGENAQTLGTSKGSAVTAQPGAQWGKTTVQADETGHGSFAVKVMSPAAKASAANIAKNKAKAQSDAVKPAAFFDEDEEDL